MLYSPDYSAVMCRMAYPPKMNKYLTYILSITAFVGPLLVIPSLNEGYDIPRLAFLSFMSAAILVGAGVYLAKNKNPHFKIQYILLSFCAFFLVNVLSFCVAKHHFYSIERLKDILQVGIIFVAAFAIKGKTNKKAIILALFVSAGIVGIIGILQYTGLIQENWARIHWEKGLGKRVFSTIGNPNFLAGFLLTVLPITLTISIFSNKKKHLAVAIPVFIFSFTCLLFTNSWGGWIGFVIGGIVAILLCIRAHHTVNKTKVITLVIILLVIASGFFIQKKGQIVGETTGLTARKILWETAFQMVKKKPLLGYGPDNFFVYSPLVLSRISLKEKYREFWMNKSDFILRNPGRVHNEYLSVLIDAGILGFIAFLWFIVMLLRNAKDEALRGKKYTKNSIEAAGIVGAIVGLLIQSFVSFPFRLPLTFTSFAILTGIILPNKRCVMRPIGNFKWITTALLLIGGITLGYNSINRLLANIYLTKAIEYKNAKIYEKAIYNYHKSLKYAVLTHLVYSEMGSCFRTLEINDSALIYYKKATALQPYHEVMYYNQGNILLSQNTQSNVDKAMKCFEKAVDIESMYTLAYMKIAGILETQGKVDSAISLLKKGINYIPWDIGLHNELGILYAKKGMLNDAVEEFEKCKELSYRNMLIRYNLHYLRKRKFENLIGLNDFEWINKKMSESQELKQKNKLNEAEALLRKIIRRYPGYPDAVARILTITGKNTAVEENMLHEAFVIAPWDPVILRTLRITLAKMGKREKAIKLLIAANESKSRNKPDKAVKLLKQAIEIDPTLSTAYYNLGVYYSHIKKESLKALPFWEMYILLEPKSKETPLILKEIQKIKEFH